MKAHVVCILVIGNLVGGRVFASEGTVDAGRFQTTVTADTEEAVQALSRALVAANGLMADPRFEHLLRAQDDLRWSCSDRSIMSSRVLADALFDEPLADPPESWRFSVLAGLERRRGGGNSYTGLDARIRIARDHAGLESPAIGVKGALLNTVVHELTHLARDERGVGYWVGDACGARPRWSRSFRDFRKNAASYRLGNMAQCFAWATSRDSCDWRPDYESCMAAGVDWVGNSRHGASRDADLPIRIGACEPTRVHGLVARQAELLSECGSALGADWLELRMERLDSILAAVDQRLAKEGLQLDTHHADDESIRHAFRLVDEEIYRLGGLTCVNTPSLEQTLGPLSRASDRGWGNVEIVGQECTVYLGNDYRRDIVRSNVDRGVWPFDCDTGALLYLAVAERHGWPVHIVEVPKHNFVRWRRPDGTTVNWDVNDARSYLDDEYRAGTALFASAFDSSIEEKGRYLQDISPAEVERYYLGLYVVRLADSSCVASAFDKLGAPVPATTQNAFAWAFATAPHFAGTQYAEMGVGLAESAVAANPGSCDRWDTLSCARAAVGDFSGALRVEREHLPNSRRSRFYAEGRNCYESEVAQAFTCP